MSGDAAVSVDEFRERVRNWLSGRIPLKSPGESLLQLDDAGVARDRAIARSLWQGRIAGTTVPVRYGGLGLSNRHEQAFREEAAPYRMPEVYGNALNVVLPTLLAHGSERLKEQFIPRILSGEHIWCQLLSEPSGGSDLAGALTRATRDGDEYVLSGAKIWTTAGNHSDYGICLARTNPDVPKHAGLTMFVVPMHSPGMTVLPLRRLDGEADFCQEFIDDVVVPVDHVIGEVDDGWRVATSLMMSERIAMGRGWSQAARPDEEGATGIEFDRTLMEQARSAGLDDDPAVRELIGEAWVLATVQNQTTRRVSEAMRQGLLPGPAASLLRAMAGLTPVRLGEIALAISGPGAVAWSAGAKARGGLDRLTSHGIGGGTTEMGLNAVAERLLGLPREPGTDKTLPFNALRHNRVETR